MFIVLVSLEAKPGGEIQLGQMLKSQAAKSLEEEPGCRQFDVLTYKDKSEHFLLYEVYESEQAFSDHLEMNHTMAFLNEVKPLVCQKNEQHLFSV
ncbi:putative quinol monooxygenase [Franzmannia qiaohouensis]|uniref:Antibiotic biosynthesis monooxygenase n=1 Tax=Franzmannia qiaohouensis TaxID=1329370 RepID=A0ABU1HKY6_9GAMM|nr:antibiotic biosynthesis monooxygenase [Halomonas qiaohouensis]MDR5907474.1 antibiotic biosynthesis monooxygenase [Halomonas qiaohouensis]